MARASRKLPFGASKFPHSSHFLSPFVSLSIRVSSFNIIKSCSKSIPMSENILSKLVPLPEVWHSMTLWEKSQLFPTLLLLNKRIGYSEALINLPLSLSLFLPSIIHLRLALSLSPLYSKSRPLFRVCVRVGVAYPSLLPKKRTLLKTSDGSGSGRDASQVNTIRRRKIEIIQSTAPEI